MRVCFLLAVLLALSGCVTAAVGVLPIPNGGKVASVALDDKGVLHMAYGKDGNSYYVQTRDGKTFTVPVQLTARAGAEMERGPQLALGQDGAIHIAWMGHFQRGGGMWYTRSTDGGKTFEPERNVSGRPLPGDGIALAADAQGHVLIIWRDGRLGPQDGSIPAACPIIMTRSSDNGRTFTQAEAVKSDYPSGLACGCCMMAVQFTADGTARIAFRGANKNIRDIILLTGRVTENNFTSTAVSADNWVFAGCPMDGPRFNAGGADPLLIAWASQGKAYWTRADKMPGRFLPRIAALSRGQQTHPTVITNSKGDVLLVWSEGDAVRWAQYAADGTPTRLQGTASPTGGRDRVTAFATPAGDFYIVL